MLRVFFTNNPAFPIIGGEGFLPLFLDTSENPNKNDLLQFQQLK